MRTQLSWLVFIVIYFVFSVQGQTSETDLALTLEAYPHELIMGERFYLSYLVRNVSTVEAEAVSLIQSLPNYLKYIGSDRPCIAVEASLSCALGRMGLGDERRLVVRLELIAEIEAVESTVLVASSSPESLLTNNRLSLSFASGTFTETDLALESAQTTLELAEGDAIFWDLSLVNLGMAAAEAVHLRFTIPETLVYLGSDEDCFHSQAVLDCYWEAIAAGERVDFRLPLGWLNSGSDLELRADLLSISDTNNANMQVVSTVHLLESPSSRTDLALSRLGNGIVAGQQQSFSLSLRFQNLSAVPVMSAVVHLRLPNTLRLLGLGAFACVEDVLGWLCQIGRLSAGADIQADLRLSQIAVLNNEVLHIDLASEIAELNLANNFIDITLGSSVNPSPTRIATTSAIAPTSVSSMGNSSSQNQAQVSLSPTAQGPSHGNRPSEQYGWRRYESSDFVQVLGHWTLRQSQNASGRAYHESRDSGALLRYPFTGDGFRIAYRSTVNGAPFEVHLDGELIATYQTDYAFFSAHTNEARQTYLTEPVFVSSDYHVLDIVSLADGGGSLAVNIDFIEIFNGPPLVSAASTEGARVGGEESVVSFSALQLAPTPVPTLSGLATQAVSIRISVAVDENRNQVRDSNEGISGLRIQVLGLETKQVLANLETDAQGQARLELLSQEDLLLLIPLLGESHYVSLGRQSQLLEATWDLLFPAIQLPGLIP